jgi:transposase
MSRRQKDPLRSLTDEERVELSRLSRSRSAPSAQVARATAVLAIAEGQSYTATARRVGRHNGDTVAQWVARFNHDGLAAVVPRHGGGPAIRYAADQQRRILAEVARVPDREQDGNMVLEHVAGRLAPRRRWSSHRQHLHHMAYLACCQSELAEKPDVVCSRYRYAQARRRGHDH